MLTTKTSHFLFQIGIITIYISEPTTVNILKLTMCNTTVRVLCCYLQHRVTEISWRVHTEVIYADIIHNSTAISTQQQPHTRL